MARRELFATIMVAYAGSLVAADAAADPETVYFTSADSRTQLVGYLFVPPSAGPHPAVVMLHGRAGPYSSNVNQECTLVAKDTRSPCKASTLSRRHATWGAYWAGRGYLALLPDSFGPRNKAHGFGRFSHGGPERDDVNERTVRPLDAEGALKYLQSRHDVKPGRIFLQGWSNGASTALNVMYRQASLPAGGFRAAIALYPGCGPRALISQDYKAAAPVTVFLASEDEEVSAAVCRRVLGSAETNGESVRIVEYAGATHGFDDPGKKRQSIDANRAAREDVMHRASALFGN